MANWTIRRNHANIDKMSNNLNISKIFANILANRKIYDRKSAEIYIRPSIRIMYDPFLFKDMIKAVQIIKEAIKNKSKIFIYGDYDVDGVISTVILYKLLHNFSDNIYYYIPDRKTEGYGLNKEAIFYMKQKGCDLIFTCDNGIAAIEEANYIYELGMKLIILDHHEPCFDENSKYKEDILPKAEAIIDAKQKECKYPYKMLCAGAVSYKFSEAFYKYMEHDFKNQEEMFIFAAIATICDIVDLCDENRIIAKNGLRLLNNNISNNGLKALIEFKGLNRKHISEENIGFIIGPCINAAGRLESAEIAVSLFLENDFDKAYILAKRISTLNEERKKITSNSFERICQNIEKSDIINNKIIIVDDEYIDESVIGIVAGKIKEKYYRPAIVFTKSSVNNIIKGSARSIPSYNIFEELYYYRNLFQKFGGHSMAAGISLYQENLDILRKKINENCHLTEHDMTNTIRIDYAIGFSDINIELAEELSLMKPFGKENEEAIFATKNVLFKKINFVGINKDIMQIMFSDKYNNTIKAIDFKGYYKFKEYILNNFDSEKADKILSGNLKDIYLLSDIVYSIGINEYNGKRNVQIIIKDFRFI